MANKLRSAISYPHSRITNLDTMKQALLLWDEYHVIGPWKGFEPHHSPEIAEAWSLIGKVTVPHRSEQRAAHDEIVHFIEDKDRVSPKFLYKAQRANSDVYDVYPEKLLGETWYALEGAGLTSELRGNGDRPLTPWGGLIIMAKLADACAGDVFARVTDRSDAYRTIAAEMDASQAHARGTAATLPVLLSMIDARSLPLENIMRFRADETDPGLRYRLLDSVNDHIEALSHLQSPNQIRGLQDQYAREMRQNLTDLKDALRWNKIKFATSATVFTALTGAFATASALHTGPLHVGAALGAMTTAGLGLKELNDFFGAGLELSRKQRETIGKYPMAYMHALSKHRLRT